MNIDTIPDIEVIEHLDFDAELACEGGNHPLGIYGHVPAESATWWATFPCCGFQMALCAGWVDASPSYTNAICPRCSTPNPNEAMEYRTIRPT